MGKIKWYVNRLKAMGPHEIIWRIQQKKLQKDEYRKYYKLHLSVFDIPLSAELKGLHIDIEKLAINWDNETWTVFKSLDLFGVYPYENYKTSWNAGFQTKENWPEEPFSPSINIMQRVDIGDIRTNWELNRHFQFASIAKSYYCTKEAKYLNEIKYLFSDWNKHNRFLHGVEWSSCMELAIRVNSWVYAYAFIKKARSDESILDKLEHGIFVMVEHILKHRARFSSANNHLIVEMYAVALVGIITDYSPWREKALSILTKELSNQNYSDGINKEMSLHYQGFVMEAYGLLYLLLKKNQIEIPKKWRVYLSSMSKFIADSTDEFNNTIEFGDSDEGKILDLNGYIDNYYQYILQLMGSVLEVEYTDFPRHENLEWILPREILERKERYIPNLVSCRKEGGYTFIQSKDKRILIGIDHANLGFGSIAAHGHADALSIQLLVDGIPVLVDSGTYNYHYKPEDRDYYRSTAAHNTVEVGTKEQSDMLGPFIWGKKATTKLEDIICDDKHVRLIMNCSELEGSHCRIIEFDYSSRLIIKDVVTGFGTIHFHFGESLDLHILNDTVAVYKGEKRVADIHSKKASWTVDKQMLSCRYNTCYLSNHLTAKFSNSIHTEFTLY